MYRSLSARIGVAPRSTVAGRIGIVFATAFSLLGWMPSHAAGASRVLGLGSSADPPQLRLLSRSVTGMRVEFTLPALDVEEIPVDGETFQSVAIPGGGDKGTLGAPALPTFGRFVLVPDRSGVTVTATVEEEEEVAGYRIVPMQDEEATTFAYDAAAYARTGYGNDPWVTAGEPALLGGLRVVPVSFSPVRYDPSQGKLKIARRMVVEVTYAGQDLRNTPSTRRRPISPSFDTIYRQLVLGYDGPTRGQAVQPGTYLIICPNDQGVVSRLQPLINWRQRQGLPVRLATTAETGTSNTAIKAYIQNAYDSWDNPPEYVVLAADAGGSYSLPTWYESLSGYSGEGDHP
jgi:hypothetical protein